MRSFAELPAHHRRPRRPRASSSRSCCSTRSGWRSCERHADHPLLRRLEIEPLRSQFPSTTTAHLTTLYSGLPVEEHGLYEWRCYEPQEGRVIRPLLFAPAHEGMPTLRITPQQLLPWPSVFERRPTTVFQPEAIARHAVRLGGARGRATCVPFTTHRGRRARSCARRPGSATSTGTGSTPPATATARPRTEFVRAVAAGARRAGHARHAAARHRRPRPDRRDASPTTSTCSGRRCSGTSRRPPPARRATCSCTSTTPRPSCAELSSRVEGTVHLAADLFPDAGPRLRERLADVCVLPAPGPDGRRCARFPSPEQRVQGPPRRPHARRDGDLGRHDVSHGDRRQLREARSRPPTSASCRCGASSGVTSFGINQILLRPGQRGRIHLPPHQEEVFLVLAGDADAVGGGRAARADARASWRASRPNVKRQLANRDPAEDVPDARARRRTTSTSAATARRSRRGTRRRARRRRRSRCPRTSRCDRARRHAARRVLGRRSNDGEDDPFEIGDDTTQWRRRSSTRCCYDDGPAIAHVGLTLADVEIGEHRFQVVGVGGVIVTRAHRGQGMLRPVFEAALERAATLGPGPGDAVLPARRTRRSTSASGSSAIGAPVVAGGQDMGDDGDVEAAARRARRGRRRRSISRNCRSDLDEGVDRAVDVLGRVRGGHLRADARLPVRDDRERERDHVDAALEHRLGGACRPAPRRRA